jgi:restriction system protein
MGLRRSSFDDLMEFASRLSGRTSVTLAILSFVLMHGLATLLPARTPVTVGDLGSVVVYPMIGWGAKFLQFLLPAGFLIGAVGSILRRSQSHTLFKEAAAGTHRAIAQMSWGKFERLVGEAFRLQGYEVVETGGQGSDGGYDLALTKDGARLLVQCKHWRTQTVRVAVVRELYGVIAAQGVAGGFVVTSGRFTHEARRFAKGCGVELLDGDGLQSLIREVERKRAAEKDRNPIATPVHDPPLPAPSMMPTGCPQCGAVMIKRLAKRGTNAGTAFWGCSRYPSCWGKRPLA